MSHSEFPIGISAVPASQFGGGQTYFADRRPLVTRRDDDEEKQHHPLPEEFLEDESFEDEGEADAEGSEAKPDQPKIVPVDLEPTYDLSRGAEHHAHLGLLLDVKL